MTEDMTILGRIEEHDLLLEETHRETLLYEELKATINKGLLIQYGLHCIRVDRTFISFISSAFGIAGLTSVVCQDTEGKPFKMVITEEIIKDYHSRWNESMLLLFDTHSKLKSLKSRIPSIIGEL